MEPMPPPHAEVAIGLKCGGCVWLDHPVSNPCRIRRGATDDTQACVEHTEKAKDQYSEMETDPVIIRIRDLFRKPKFRVDPSLVDELRSYTNENLVQFPFGSAQELEAVAMQLKKLVHYRFRVGSIQTSALEVKHDFEELYGELMSWLYSHYPTIRALKNDAQRTAVFHRLVPEILSVNKNIEKVLEAAKTTSEALEAGEWSLRAILGANEKLWYSKEYAGGQRRP
jgi:hypothetical protein